MLCRFVVFGLLAFCAVTQVFAHSDEIKHIYNDVRGVKQRDQYRYTSTPGSFTCLDRSLTIPFARVNDDYCDCPDGSDEPGTSACANGRFWCANKGAKGKTLPSSRVGDSICDCCDGSDEYSALTGTSTCPNTCEESGRAAREAMMAEIESTEAGLTARTNLIQSASVTLQERREKMAKYETILEQRKAKRDAAKALKETEEAIENAERAKRQAELDARHASEQAAAEQAAEQAASAAAAAQTNNMPASGESQPPTVTDGVPSSPDTQEPIYTDAPSTDAPAATTEQATTTQQGEAKPAEEKKENFPYPPEYAYHQADDAASVDEPKEGKVENFPYPAEYAFKEDGDNEAAASTTGEGETVEPEYVDENGNPVPAGEHDEEDDDEESEHSDQHQEHESEEAEYVHPGAESARTAFNEIDTKVTRLEKKIKDLQQLLDRNYGPDNQFAHMDGKCYDVQVKQYTYEVCPFVNAKQKEGHSSTSLGNWDGLKEDPVTGEMTMKFTGGQTCWQGPARSLTVKLKCGREEKLLTVEEPNKCVYEIVMMTPAVCNAKHAQVLQLNLEGGMEEEEEEEA